MVMVARRGYAECGCKLWCEGALNPVVASMKADTDDGRRVGDVWIIVIASTPGGAVCDLSPDTLAT